MQLGHEALDAAAGKPFPVDPPPDLVAPQVIAAHDWSAFQALPRMADHERAGEGLEFRFKMTEAALEAPTETVEDVIYPAVPGGYKTLVTLLHEYKAKGSSYRQHKQRVFKASYTTTTARA